MFPLNDKRQPSEQWIAHLRQRFPVERTVDQALTWKLHTRRGPEYRPLSVEQVAVGLKSFLRAQVGGDVEISNLKQLTGGTSKEMFTFILEWREQRQLRCERLILRMNPGESIVESHRLREFEALRALQEVIPVPPVYWVDADGSSFGRPALVCGFVQGVTKPVGVGSNISGMGTDFGPALRPQLTVAFTNIAWRIHQFAWEHAGLSSFDVPQAGTTEAVKWNLNWWRRVWEEDALEEHPLMTLAYQWLKANMPVVDTVSLVHGDYRSGNFLFDQETARITAVLDWEMAHLGDRHDDLGYITMRCWGHLDERGEFLACGMASRDAFLAGYEQASGLPVDWSKVDYYEMLNTYKIAVVASVGPRVAFDQQTHHTAMMNFASGAYYQCLKELQRLLQGKAL